MSTLALSDEKFWILCISHLILISLNRLNIQPQLALFFYLGAIHRTSVEALRERCTIVTICDKCYQFE